MVRKRNKGGKLSVRSERMEMIFTGEEEQQVITTEAMALGKGQRQETARNVQGTVNRPAWWEQKPRMCHLEIYFKLNHRAPHVPYKVLESYGITEFALEEFSSEGT